ncbi:TonB-dependent receptor [Chitinophaga nivalis]|uniref:TonB-dependent receptor family protein n=1 Tax=Chitinophaga nivalis TaxID=2991709 RepID=A0ABT3IJR1_9BACT|nr:TonB-dependent receptor [Chitinophaga nivalis]MCW3466116.1 TonB-dependent receptor family protein [Chitinophaga nivalis]MCW3484193.1 TonB-dependent receptor family protein [Chitinophaga nivalis]
MTMLTRRKKKYALLLLLLAVSFLTYAQQGMVTGRLADSVNHQNLQNASIFLFHAADTSYRAMTVAGNNGEFSLKDLPMGIFLLEVRFQGYQKYTREIVLTKDQLLFDAGILFMAVQIKELDSVTITSPPIVIRKDTIEYHAGSFKTGPHEKVAALLRLLPGIQVLPNGKIQANGQDIQQILVDGQPFFENSPNAVLQVLPAEMIHKVAVYDAASEVSQFTGIPDGQKTKTLNLTIKRNRRNGTFGQAGVAGGSADTYGVGVQLNHFKNNRQLSFVGQGTNTNDPVFTAMAQDPASTDNGITTNRSGGVHYRDKWGPHTAINGGYTYTNEQMLQEQQSATQYIFPQEAATYQEQRSKGLSDNSRHVIRFNMETLFDANNRLTIRPYINYAQNENFAAQQSALTGGKTMPGDTMYTATYHTNGKSNTSNAAIKAMFVHKGKNGRRALSVAMDMFYNKNNTTADNYSLNQYWQPAAHTDTLHQRRQIAATRAQVKTDITYSARIGEKQSLLMQYSYKYETGKNATDVCGYDEKWQQYLIRDSTQSNRFKNQVQDHEGSISYQLTQDKYMLHIRAGWQSRQLVNNNLLTHTDIRKNYLSVIPRVSFQYNFSEITNLQFNYDVVPRQPALEQLQPTIATVDSLRIMKGNPDLKQVQVHSFSLSYQHTDAIKQKMYSATLGASMNRNDIQYAVTQLPNGVQIMMPVNVNGAYSIVGNVNYAFPVSRLKSTLQFTAGIDYVQNKTILNEQDVYTRNIALQAMVSLQTNISRALSLTLSGNASYHMLTYTPASTATIRYFTGNVSGNVRYTLGKSWQLLSDFNVAYNSSVQTGGQHWIPMVSPAVTRQLFKDKSGELKLRVFDLLNQNTNMFISVDNNRIQRLNTNTRQRYVMLSFTYNFQRFRK